MTKTQEKWPPDWRDEDQYPDPDPKKTTSKQWAWEFLRRNSEYEQLCQEWHFLTVPKEKISIPVIPSEPKDMTMEELNRSIDFFDSEEWKARERRLDELRVLLTEKFGIRVPPPLPSQDDPDRTLIFKHTLENNPTVHCIDFNPSHLGIQLADKKGKKSLRGTSDINLINMPKQISIIFDLTHSIPHQIRMAKKFLEVCKFKGGFDDPEFHSSTPQQYREYLRILDAVKDGKKTSDMAEHLFKEKSNESITGYQRNKAIEAGRVRAEKLRDSDYRHIGDQSVLKTSDRIRVRKKKEQI